MFPDERKNTDQTRTWIYNIILWLHTYILVVVRGKWWLRHRERVVGYAERLRSEEQWGKDAQCKEYRALSQQWNRTHPEPDPARSWREDDGATWSWSHISCAVLPRTQPNDPLAHRWEYQILLRSASMATLPIRSSNRRHHTGSLDSPLSSTC